MLNDQGPTKVSNISMILTVQLSPWQPALLLDTGHLENWRICHGSNV